MKKLLTIFLLLFSFSCLALEPVNLIYKTGEDGRNFKRQRAGFRHNSQRSKIDIFYYEWVEFADGSIDVTRSMKSYSLTGSYYFELSLASSGTTSIGDFLDALIDLRLVNTADDIKSSIEVNRTAKDAAMVPFGYVP